MEPVCFYCLVNDDQKVPAVTMYDGSAYCQPHAKEQAQIAVQEASNAANQQRAIQERLRSLDPRRS